MNRTEVGEALGHSEAFLDFQARLSQVAPVDRPVLLLGERGTGKELAAMRLHYLSKRWERPLVTLNCAALTPTLIESELFGHERGAFTGAERRRAGRFELAHGGTLFLDEVASIPMQVQEKILRVVEYGYFERVGGGAPVEVDVRIIGAANLNLAQLASEGKFKQDLLDRLSFEVLFLPPLRHRVEDIALLAEHFARRFARELEREDEIRFSAAAMTSMEQYPWPGNIRELKNVVERAVYRSESGLVDEVVFDPFSSPYLAVPTVAQVGQEIFVPSVAAVAGDVASGSLSFKEVVAELEAKLLGRALSQCQHHQKKAANYLDLTYDQFRHLLKKHAARLAAAPSSGSGYEER